jgi:hypothetical protein
VIVSAGSIGSPRAAADQSINDLAMSAVQLLTY